MAGKSYARNKKRRKSGKAWHKGRIQHELCDKTRQNAHFNSRKVTGEIKADFTVEKNYRTCVGVKCVNRLSEAKQTSHHAFDESMADDNSITSAFDGHYVDNLGEVVGEEMTYPTQYDLEREFEDGSCREIDSEEYKLLRKMTRKSYKQIRTMEATLWVGRSERESNCDPRDIRHSRPPHWRDWTPVAYDVRPIAVGDGVGDSPIRIKKPTKKSPYGTGLDVEGRAQMNARFEKFIGNL